MRKMKRFVSMVMAAILMFSLLGMSVAASEVDVEEETSSKTVYEASNSYALNYGKKYSNYVFEYGSPYVPLLYYDQSGEPEPYTEWIGTCYLYNTANPEQVVSTYCIDEYTSVPSYNVNVCYRRLNLEDATYYSDDVAAQIRSIVLNGFPNVSLETLSAASGVSNLTLGEAVSATQLAIWRASYADELTLYDIVSQIYPFYCYRGYETITRYATECYQEVKEIVESKGNSNHQVTGEDLDTYLAEHKIDERIDQVYDYLLNLAPTAPMAETVSEASFISWGDNTVLTDNGDGTYDVTVTATVKVVENAGDELRISAVLGDYFVSEELTNGTNDVTLTIPSVPASAAREDVKIAIDGTQTVSDVYLYSLEGGREVAQERVGYSDIQLPVHAEITVGAERIIRIHKTGTIANGSDTYETIPLEGITFDLYFVADWDAYMKGEVDLPDEIDVDSLGGAYHYPTFSITTDKNGEASVSLTKNGLPDGVYVIAERENAAVKAPAKPFYVLLPYTNKEGTAYEYEIDIYPKNEVKGDIEIGKDVIEVDNDSATVDAYKTHTWIITTSIPEDIANGKFFKISDTLDNRLDYIGNVKVQVEHLNDNTADPVILTEGTDYILTVTDNDSLSEGNPSDSFTVELTASGMRKVGNAVNGDFANHVIRVYFDAQINANAQMGEEIPNQATLEYTNSVNADFDKISDIPEVHTGGVKLSKVDSKNQEQTLAGAVFKIFRPATTEELNDESVEKVYIEGYPETAMVLVSFFDNEALSGEKVTEVISDENGKVVIYGLAYGTYYLVETQVPAGYNLLAEPYELIINENSHMDEHIVKVLNNSGMELPETGGMGTTIFMTAGLILVLGAGVLLVTRRRMGLD